MEANAIPRKAFDATSPSTKKDTPMSSTNRKAIVIAVLCAIVLIALISLAVWFLSRDPARTANIRDIVIVLLAIGTLLVNIGIGIVLIVLVYRLQDLIELFRSEVKPTLTNVSDTVKQVRSTTEFVSDSVAKPAIKIAGFMAGIRTIAKATRKKVNDRRS
jgi:hypothetical protein